MKFVFIYGAPGVGKLTTARALADLTGFKLFHNHLSVNLVRTLFEFASPAFHELSATVRLAAFEAAARAKLPGVIFTFVYAESADDAFVAQVVQTVERQEGEDQSLDIDNSAQSPEDVARRIARHFALPEAKGGARS